METGRGPWLVIERASGHFEHFLERGHEARDPPRNAPDIVLRQLRTLRRSAARGRGHEDVPRRRREPGHDGLSVDPDVGVVARDDRIRRDNPHVQIGRAHV